MALRFYNTLSRKKEAFIPIKEGEVSIYTCGPTVYDYAHLGNFRAYVFEDILRRYLIYKDYKVVQVQNITDVDDKTIKGSKDKGVSLRDYTEKYKMAFFEDLATLNIGKAEHYPRATDHIPEMVDIVKALLDKGLAYVGQDNSIYYAVSKFKDYGALSGVDLTQAKPGARVHSDEYGKDEARDFALWKAWDFEDGEVAWKTDIGKGRPGWHLECSAMSMKYLGETFDIHAGGVDLVFPHHENEIAQSVGATGKPFVRYWLHNEHLLVENQKMSKSLGNFYTLRGLLEKGHDPMAIRYLLLSSHYRQKLNFTWKRLEDAARTVKRLQDFARKLDKMDPGGPYSKEFQGKVHGARDAFISFMDDDLNTPRALAAIFDLIHETNREVEKGSISKENLGEVREILIDIDRVLGILGDRDEGDLADEIEDMIRERDQARIRKDFTTADRIRDELAKRGIILEDTPQGPRWNQG